MANSTAEYLAKIEATLAEILRSVEANAPRPQAAAESPFGFNGRTVFDQSSQLGQSCRWAVEGGGKRVRPRICLAAAVAAGGRAEDALMPACAIELLHSYTLVHDDLPAMDNDTMRRGKPSVWAKFGEADAILTGDALQAMAFRVAAQAPRNASLIVASLAAAAEAVVSGQVADLEASRRRVEGNAPDRIESSVRFDEQTAFEQRQCKYIIENKTAALFVAAAEMGALAVDAPPDSIQALKSYAYHLGLAFQYEDDLLDADDGAFSSLSIFGKDEVRRLVSVHTDSAVYSLAVLHGDISPLSELATSLVSRTK